MPACEDHTPTLAVSEHAYSLHKGGFTPLSDPPPHLLLKPPQVSAQSCSLKLPPAMATLTVPSV